MKSRQTFSRYFCEEKPFGMKERKRITRDSSLVTRESRDRRAVALQLVSKSSLTPQLSSLASPSYRFLSINLKKAVFPEVFPLLSEL